jgi:hypothetical protein
MAFAAFWSQANNLVAGDGNTSADVRARPDGGHDDARERRRRWARSGDRMGGGERRPGYAAAVTT